jgi:hypothetical protein
MTVPFTFPALQPLLFITRRRRIMSARRQARTRTYVFEQGEPMTGEPAADRQDMPAPISTTPGLFFWVSWVLPGVYGAVCSRRAEKFLCDARDGCRKIGIVRSALDDGLLFDEGLILPM